jgi:multidrug transporter EmrE-like cation transporter
MAWVILFVAGLFEIGLVMGLNFSEGFTKLLPSLGMLVSGGPSSSRTSWSAWPPSVLRSRSLACVPASAANR